MTASDKATANHLYNRVRIYDALIDEAAEAGEFKEEERLEAVQSEIRAELRKIIGL